MHDAGCEADWPSVCKCHYSDHTSYIDYTVQDDSHYEGSCSSNCPCYANDGNEGKPGQ